MIWLASNKNRCRILFSAVPAGGEGNRSAVSSHNVIMQFSKWQETGHLLPPSRFHKRCSINSFTKAALSKSLRRANGVSRNRPSKKSRSKEDDKLIFSSEISFLKIMFLPPAFSKRQWEGAVLQSNETVYCSICTSSPERESIRLDFRASLASLIALNPKWKAQLCFSRGDSADGKKFALIFHIRANTERAVETKSQFLWLAKTWLRNQIICI